MAPLGEIFHHHLVEIEGRRDRFEKTGFAQPLDVNPVAPLAADELAEVTRARRDGFAGGVRPVAEDGDSRRKVIRLDRQSAGSEAGGGLVAFEEGHIEILVDARLRTAGSHRRLCFEANGRLR